jgi:hypothetical protein
MPKAERISVSLYIERGIARLKKELITGQAGQAR